ncbi:putative cation/H+ exchanger [Lupinus albus]|uniref:Putative cation/H+ exchanger n=1 Tax=Lupinus albus TaxID=3870 RepID=A0A6A4QR69_LUPAL|nr:putative cation/H+ exchanger [Lupinus albus]
MATQNECSQRLGYLIFQLSTNFMVFMAMVIARNGLHFALKPYSQPRITSDIIVGLIMGNLGFLRSLYEEFNKTFAFIIDVGMMCYMFALGIEMDPYALFKRPTRDAQVAYVGIISTFLLAVFLSPFLFHLPTQHRIEFTLSLSTLLSSTTSPILTHLITQLKIGKSDIGKLVIAAGMHSEFLCSLFFSLVFIAMPWDTLCTGTEDKKRHWFHLYS